MCIFQQVQATDEDAGENGQVLFSFVEQPSDFAIDELTGEIRALVSFDYDQQPPNYVYTIQVTDNSTSPLSSTARFVANITDINDNAPVFVSFPADRNLIETASVGQEIARVSATDRDSGDNADVCVTQNCMRVNHLILRCTLSRCVIDILSAVEQ